MIGRLRGEVVYKRPPFMMVEVNGVGYELEAPMSTFYELPPVGATVPYIPEEAEQKTVGGKTYFVYCNSGNRSGNAMGIMRDLGFVDVYDLDGGIQRPRTTSPLQRAGHGQVPSHPWPETPGLASGAAGVFDGAG